MLPLLLLSSLWQPLLDSIESALSPAGTHTFSVHDSLVADCPAGPSVPCRPPVRDHPSGHASDHHTQVVPGGGAGFHELYRALAGEEVHEAWGPERASYAQSD